MADKKYLYKWDRFWAPINSTLTYTNGFLHNPEDILGKYIHPDLISLSKINDKNCCVLLGEPGMGKSTEIEKNYQSILKEKGEENVLYIDFKNIPSMEIFKEELTGNFGYQNWSENGSDFYLYLDSFDEALFSIKSIANYIVLLFLKNKDKAKNLHVKISCRTAVWPSFVDDKLAEIWGIEEILKYELCPLTEDDIEIALDDREISSQEFLFEIHKKEVESLAGRPITLNLLIDIYKDKKSLPDMKSDIYLEGIKLLTKENDKSKLSSINRPTLDLNKRLLIAERIAFTTLLTNKLMIALQDKSTNQENELTINELAGREILVDLFFDITEGDIREVLNTGLFSSRGNDRMGWAHQTYGEFLAAQYILRHRLSWKQIKKILFHDPLGSGQYQHIPQLYEVGSWLASANAEFFDEAVLIDPQFLLLSDTNAINDFQKEKLTGQVLVGLSNGDFLDRWEIFNHENYKRLCHPAIDIQLKTYINDLSKNVIVRRSAIEIALACFNPSLEESLLKIALNNNDNLMIRIRAVRVIGEHGSKKSKEILKTLLNTDFTNDPEDELKGSLLRALWPNHILPNEIFNFLTPPKKHNFYGSYHAFIDRDFGRSLREEDILEGLNWITENAMNTKEIEYSFRKLSDAIMLKAWENFDDSSISEVFTKIAYTRLKNYEDIVGENVVDDDLIDKFQKYLEDETDKRHSFLVKLINTLVNDPEQESGKKGYILLPHGKIGIVYPSDTSWLVQLLLKEKNVETQKVLSEIISRTFDIKNVSSIEIVKLASMSNSFLNQETRYWFESVELTSNSAKEQKKVFEQQKEWSKRKNKAEEQLLDKISIPEIMNLLEKCEAGDMNSWWQIHNRMCIYQHELDDQNIENLPGWKLLKPDVQIRIMNCGKKFLVEQESKPEIWLGKNKTYFPACAGYRALKYFFNKDKDFLKSLNDSVWKKWAPIVIGMPLIVNDPESTKIIENAYKHAPEEIISTLDSLIDMEQESRNGSYIIDLVENCVDEKMCKFLLNKARQKNLNPNVKRDIFNFLLKHKDQTAKTDIKSLIKFPLSESNNESMLMAIALFWNADASDWDFLWKSMQKDKESAILLIESSHENPLRGSNILQNLTESQLSELYIWLMKNFPPDKYFQPEGGYTVTPNISIAEWRDSIIRILMNKGTKDAVTQIDQISKLLPQYSWIKEHTLAEAKRIALEKTWQPLSASTILKIVENQELRLIEDVDHLMEIVLESINNFEKKLQHQEQPQSIELWNENRVSSKVGNKLKRSFVYSPKDENRLSDKLNNHIKEELKTKGVIGRREVEVYRVAKTDIHIEAFTRDQLGRPNDLLKVIIEVKGCWNKDVDTAMSTQLRDKYLSRTNCQRGIYLVGWYFCDKWNDTNDKRNNKPKELTIDKAKEKYSTQAEVLSTDNIKIKSIVLDIRLK